MNWVTPIVHVNTKQEKRTRDRRSCAPCDHNDIVTLGYLIYLVTHDHKCILFLVSYTQYFPNTYVSCKTIIKQSYTWSLPNELEMILSLTVRSKVISDMAKVISMGCFLYFLNTYLSLKPY